MRYAIAMQYWQIEANALICSRSNIAYVQHQMRQQKQQQRQDRQQLHQQHWRKSRRKLEKSTSEQAISCIAIVEIFLLSAALLPYMTLVVCKANTDCYWLLHGFNYRISITLVCCGNAVIEIDKFYYDGQVASLFHFVLCIHRCHLLGIHLLCIDCLSAKYS